MSLAYLNINLDHIRERECGPIVNAENVCLGRRVQWGKHWSKKWRDNVVNGVRIYGTITANDPTKKNVRQDPTPVTPQPGEGRSGRNQEQNGVVGGHSRAFYEEFLKLKEK